MRRTCGSLCVLVLLAAGARADTVHVPADYGTIQAAVDAATGDRLILLAPGIYVGNVSIGSAHHVQLRGTAGAEATILLGDGSAPVVHSDSGGSILEDVTVGGGTHGLEVAAAEPFGVNGCVFTANAGWGVTGTAAFFGFSVTDCRFAGNGTGGLSMELLDVPAISSPKVQRCIFGPGQGVVFTANISFSFNARLLRCTLDGASASSGAGLWVRDSIVRGATLTSLVQPLSVTYSDVEGGAPGTGNIDADPLWAAAGGGDYSLLPGSPCINAADPSLPPDADGTRADMGAVPFVTWADLGLPLAGTYGDPELIGTGTLAGGDPVAVDLSGALESAPAFLFLGLSELGFFPFYGGTLVPDFTAPPGQIIIVFTDGSGEVTLGTTWPMGLPSGFEIYLQYWIDDPGAPFGYAASNAIQGTTP